MPQLISPQYLRSLGGDCSRGISRAGLKKRIESLEPLPATEKQQDLLFDADIDYPAGVTRKQAHDLLTSWREQNKHLKPTPAQLDYIQHFRLFIPPPFGSHPADWPRTHAHHEVREHQQKAAACMVLRTVLHSSEIEGIAEDVQTFATQNSHRRWQLNDFHSTFGNLFSPNPGSGLRSVSADRMHTLGLALGRRLRSALYHILEAPFPEDARDEDDFDDMPWHQSVGASVLEVMANTTSAPFGNPYLTATTLGRTDFPLAGIQDQQLLLCDISSY